MKQYIIGLIVVWWGLISPVFAGPVTLADVDLAAVKQWFVQADQLGEEVREPGYRLVYFQREVVGAVFMTTDILPVPAYSGKPVTVLVALDTQADIKGLKITHHEEPILVVGVSEQDLKGLTDQYQNIYALDSVRVNTNSRQGYVSVDGISGATITTMVLNHTIMGSAKQVATALNWSREQNPASAQDSSASVAETDSNQDLVDLWRASMPKIVALSAALILLLFILIFQNRLVKKPRLFNRLRMGYLLFTVVVIGYLFSAQLSVVNVLTVIQSVGSGFSWTTFAMEPAIFILWSFVAATILFWGRGVFCGWLCPFGAIQDLLFKLASMLKIPDFELPRKIHERLWSVKYLILIVLVGLSLTSFSKAAAMAEIEPYKTVLVMKFAREWGYVLYAGGLLFIGLFNSKFYCKYLCPLGAGLSIAGRFHLFDWLQRREECGTPCQSCALQCQTGAIRPTGEILTGECHYCLECQVAYWNDKTCPPLVSQRKKQEAKNPSRRGDNNDAIAIIGKWG